MSFTTLHLVKTYCLPALLFGCEIWNLSAQNTHRLVVFLVGHLILVIVLYGLLILEIIFILFQLRMLILVIVLVLVDENMSFLL